ncbi:ribosomal RNA large subunit methyltransferase E [Cocos nucifera]|uniref:rRNA methyltransferase 2, mitochondrial n=1 Tax=Cocos nucifera TaxID=13894 RepID=A0A8K0I5G4_COCNU|nr:ribosomal RNA large subunit methyltransferase E [Cocos nucifera]
MSGVGAPDFFYREAQRLGYVARSAFKLLQMQKQYKLITPGASILDLGCAPGAWLQVACQSLGPLEKGGVVVGIDLKDRGFSVMLSDMCPTVSGITTKDAAISCELGVRALSLAVGRVRQPSSANNTDLEDYLSSSEPDANEDGVLQHGGNLVIKLLESEDIQGLTLSLFTWFQDLANSANFVSRKYHG